MKRLTLLSTMAIAALLFAGCAKPQIFIDGRPATERAIMLQNGNVKMSMVVVNRRDDDGETVITFPDPFQWIPKADLPSELHFYIARPKLPDNQPLRLRLIYRTVEGDYRVERRKEYKIEENVNVGFALQVEDKFRPCTLQVMVLHAQDPIFILPELNFQ